MTSHHLIATSLLTLSLFSNIPQVRAAEPAPITVNTAWLRATPKGAPVAGGYATIINSGTTADRLVGASLPGAKRGEIHTMSMKAGVMHMERLDKGLEIAPGATVTLSPGGYHIMFIEPATQLKEGQSVEGTLSFEKAGTVKVMFAVAGMGAKTAPGVASGGADMKGMDMKGMDMTKH